MSELNYPQGSHEWASAKGIRRKCKKHNIEYDPHTGCKKCAEEEREERRKREEKKRKLKAAFDNVKWPDK